MQQGKKSPHDTKILMTAENRTRAVINRDYVGRLYVQRKALIPVVQFVHFRVEDDDG